MTVKPSEAAIREACRRMEKPEAFADEAVRRPNFYDFTYLAASLIEKHEPETLVEPELLRARILLAEEAEREWGDGAGEPYRRGDWDMDPRAIAVIRALKEGMPK